MKQWKELVRLDKEIKHLKAQLSGSKKAPKTSKNSSTPSSQDKKNNQKEPPKPRSRHHNLGGRDLSDNPDHQVDIQPECCSNCQGALIHQVLQSVYDTYELPTIKPIVTQVFRYKGYCQNCSKEVLAKVPTHLKNKSIFGSSIQSLAFYFHYAHAVSYSRLTQMFKEVFGLAISEGSLANIFRTSQDAFQQSTDKILEKLRQSYLIASDETSARVNGKTQWEWVFQNEEVCFHVIRPSRASKVKEEVLKGYWPEVWVSDLFGSQRNHQAKQWQVCIPHQLRDCQYGIDCGDTVFSVPMLALLKESLTARKLENKEKALQELRVKLSELLALTVQHPDGLRLQKRYRKIQGNLFIFLENERIPASNNSSERALRMSTIFRKVTNGFRSDWGPNIYASFRSVVNTAQRQKVTAFQAICDTLALAPT